MNGNCYVLANSRWAILPCLLMADGGNLGISQQLSHTSKNCPEAIQLSLGIAQQLLFTLLAVPSGCPITFKSISQRLLAKTEQFVSIFPDGLISVNIYKKSKEHWKILKTTSGSSPRTDLSYNITVSRSQFVRQSL
jgi:hypothetical protein